MFPDDEMIWKEKYTLEKLTAGTPKLRWMEDDFPFQLGDFRFNMITGWWLNHPSQKYARQNGNLPQIGMEIKIYLKPPPR